LQLKKIRGKIIFFGTIFAVANLAESLAQHLLAPAILAVFGQNLPFWQKAHWLTVIIVNRLVQPVQNETPP